ncbi:MAG TPA: hypothetical protein PL129_06260 [bacterium]|nr:hypothetical protein [bacterium]
MSQEGLSREFKVNLIKSVYSKTAFDEVIAKANPYQLSDIQEFMWDAALYIGRDEAGKPITREMITSQMMPTTEYWRGQLCGEPIDTCRGRSCFVSHPVCAGNKLRAQIEVIRSCFDRRKQRSQQNEEGILMLLMYHINENHYAAAGLYDIQKHPIKTVGSRVLSGDSLRNVIQAMNVAVGQGFTDSHMVQPVIIGEAKLMVEAKLIGSAHGDCVLALTVPEDESSEKREKIFKKIETNVRRITASAKA